MSNTSRTSERDVRGTLDGPRRVLPHGGRDSEDISVIPVFLDPSQGVEHGTHNNNRAPTNYQNVPVERGQSSMTDLWSRYMTSNGLEIQNNEQSVYGRGRNGSNREVPHHDIL